MKILNKEELDTWLFEHAQVKGHFCSGIKNPERTHNIAWLDEDTNERIDIIYSVPEGGDK